MNTSLKLLAAALLSASLAGCASTGNQKVGSMTTEAAAQASVPIGATKAQVEQTFGAPDVKTFGLEGQEVWTYQHTYAYAKASSFIPIIGPFVGGVNADRKQLIVLFGADDRVARVLWNAGPTEIRHGR